MKNFRSLKFWSAGACFLSGLLFLVPSAKANEPWKGHTETSPVEVGVMSGLSLHGSESAWSVLGTAAYLMEPQGWIDDIDDRIWIEGEVGPSFFSTRTQSQTGLQYSAHLRWDFTYNEYWTLYALGGLSGFILPSYLGSSFTVFPRVGLGVEYQTKTALMFRGELSHEFIGLGVALNF